MADFIDFRTIKESVSIEAVLKHYEIRKLRPVNQHTLRGHCPLPTHSSESSKESFSVQTNKNIWACQSNSCAATRQGKRGGNVLDLVSIMEQCSIREAAVKLDTWFRSSTPSPNKSTRQGTGVEKKLVSKTELATPDEPNKPLSFTLKDVDHAHQYLQSRGVGENVAREFGAGFFSRPRIDDRENCFRDPQRKREVSRVRGTRDRRLRTKV